MPVCMDVCIQEYPQCVNRRKGLDAHTHTNAHPHMRSCVRAHTRAGLYVCMYVCTHIRTYIGMPACMFTCVCIYTCICIHMYYMGTVHVYRLCFEQAHEHGKHFEALFLVCKNRRASRCGGFRLQVSVIRGSSSECSFVARVVLSVPLSLSANSLP